MNRKRITKKATLALVAMMTVTSVVGCSQSNNSNKNQQGSNQKTEQKTDKNVSAHYYSCGVDDSFDSACKICHIEPMGGIHSVHGSVSGNRI